MHTLRLLLLLAVAGASLSAQSITGNITGTVQDPSSLPVNGAGIRLTQVSTGAQRNAETNHLGVFFFGSLQPGTYNLSVESQGFKRLEQRSIHVSAAETLALGALVLEVGSVAESVSVIAQGATVQTQTAERAGVLTGSQVENLAIRGRNVMSLLQLLPGVVDLDEPENLTQNWNVYALGNRRNTNNVSLDGATLNAVGNQFNSVVNISMDAVAEVKVLMSNYQAEYGRLSGANVHMVSKSGTREFHGLASYFKRHEQFNANDFFNNQTGQPKPRYRFNTWNYNLGGPVTIPGKFNTNRDKLFFFWSQEFWPLRVASAITQRTVPTPLEREGNFSQSLDLNNRLIVVRDPFGGGIPFPGNVVPTARVDHSGQALIQAFPQPNFFDRGISRGNFNYVFQDAQHNPQRTETLKLDYHLNTNNLLTGNFTHRVTEQEGALGVPGAGTQFDQLRQRSINAGKLWIVRYQRIFSPTLINEANVSYSTRPLFNEPDPEALRRNQRDQVGFNIGQFNPNNNPLNVLPNATFGGVPGAANFQLDGRFPLDTTHEIFTFSNNVTKTFPGHTLKLGFYMDRLWADNQNNAPNFGAFDFGRNVNNPLDTGYAYSNAILGVFNSYTEASDRPLPRAIVSNIEFFVQDNWRLTKRLTLDLGIRFYLLPHSFVTDNRIAGFDPAHFDPARQAQLIQPGRSGNQRVGVHPATGEIFPANFIGAIAPGAGDPANGMVSHVLDQGLPTSLMDDRGLHFGPRAGFAFDVFGNNKTAVRGGFGMFYNRMAQGMVLYPFSIQPPLVATPQIFFGTLSTLLASTGVLFPSNVLGLDRQAKIPTVMNYSLSIQQDVGFGTVLDIGYVGSLGRHLLWQRNLNAIPFGANFDPANLDPTTNRPLPPAFLRQFTGYNNTNVREPGSSSNYHSLQVTANRRFARGVQFGASWTWSKAMGFNDNDNEGVSTLVPVRVWNYGLASYDRTHVLKLNWLWDVPRSPLTHPLAKAVLNDWQFSGIASFVSGEPLPVNFSTTTPIDITGSPTDGARIVVTGNPVLPKSERTFQRFFRSDVFQLPAVGTIGNAAPTLIRGPGINNWDLAVYKNFLVREPARLQFRWELYNAFNHTQFSGLDNAARFDSSTGAQVNERLGQLTTARRARIMQFALRFTF
ncbi:MAG: carboxypeptidase-like regulatory domain-containing protein [Bryobacteraceae bacterium]